MKRRVANEGLRGKANTSSIIGTMTQVEIERLVPGGYGLAHAEGHTIFVALAAPGDCLRVRLDRVQGKLAFASIIEILRPSPQRVTPPCPYFGKCGGCDFQQLDYPSQLAAKLDIVRDCLRRIAKIDAPPEMRIVGAPDPWRYRARAQWQFDLEQRACGYFERGTHRIVDVDICPVLVPELQELLFKLREHLPAEFSSASAAGEFQAVAGEDGVSFVSSANDGEARLVSRHIGGEQYFFSADGFFQINHQLLAELIDEAVGDEKGNLALDLYCGVGLFSLPLARRFARVIGVEGNASAVALAGRNAQGASPDGDLRFVIADVGQWLAGQSGTLREIDLILLDPPRAGAEKEVIESILRIAPERIAYVSCDPATLARDLRMLSEAHYQIKTLTAFDLFSQTHHVETVVQLKRQG